VVAGMCSSSSVVWALRSFITTADIDIR